MACLSVLLLLAAVCHTSMAIICENLHLPTGSEDCAATERKCFVMVSKVQGYPQDFVAHKCASPSDEADCGLYLSDPVTGNWMKLCCCDTDKCNDEAFVKACIENAKSEGSSGAGGSSSTGAPLGTGVSSDAGGKFECHKKNIVDGKEINVSSSSKQECSGDNLNRCVVYMEIGRNNGSKIINQKTQSCLRPETKDKCGYSVTRGNTETKVCCCDTPLCNDDAFANKCSGSRVIQSSVSFLLLTLIVKKLMA